MKIPGAGAVPKQAGSETLALSPLFRVMRLMKWDILRIRYQAFQNDPDPNIGTGTVTSMTFPFSLVKLKLFPIPIPYTVGTVPSDNIKI